jgi:hypothetical protein
MLEQYNELQAYCEKQHEKMSADYARLERERDELKTENARLVRTCSMQQSEIQQTLGRALGYPLLCADQKNFPGYTEADGVCVGDHVAETLASEAATELARLRAVEAAEPEWVVNDLGELGVKVGGRFFFCYKGYSLEYKEGTHDDGTPMLWRLVGKREFGETVWPLKWVTNGRREDRYTVDLKFYPGLSDGKPDDPGYQWAPLPALAEACGRKA